MYKFLFTILTLAALNVTPATAADRYLVGLKAPGDQKAFSFVMKRAKKVDRMSKDQAAHVMTELNARHNNGRHPVSAHLYRIKR